MKDKLNLVRSKKLLCNHEIFRAGFRNVDAGQRPGNMFGGELQHRDRAYVRTDRSLCEDASNVYT